MADLYPNVEAAMEPVRELHRSRLDAGRRYDRFADRWPFRCLPPRAQFACWWLRWAPSRAAEKLRRSRG